MFWASTPVEVGELLKAFNRRENALQRVEYFRNASLLAAVWSFYSAFTRSPRHFTAWDFMPDEGPKMVEPEQLGAMLSTWAKGINKKLAAT